MTAMAGRTGTALSAALGMAAPDQRGTNENVVAMLAMQL